MPEINIAALIQNATEGRYDIPEFQREFVWKPKQVAQLAESLLLKYPVGCLTLWKKPGESSVGNDKVYVVDGQQRLTALCIVFEKRPSWKNLAEWQDLMLLYKPYLSVSPEKGDFYIGGRKRGWISLPLPDIVNCASEDDVNQVIRDTLDEAAEETREDARSTLLRAARDLWNVAQIRLPYVEMYHDDPLQVAESYMRLNEKGTRIRETDTQLAFIAVYNKGWVKSEFRAFLHDLDTSTQGKWAIAPGLLLRTMTILDSGTPRVAGVPKKEEFWKTRAKEVFSGLRPGVQDFRPRIERYGVYELRDVPSDYTLIAALALHTRFHKQKGYDFDKLFWWFIAANITGRYGDAPLETLSNDGRIIQEAASLNDAFTDPDFKINLEPEKLREMMQAPFKRRSPAALMLKALLWNEGLDWKKGGKLSNFPPLEWHHIVPKKVCNLLGFRNENTVANMTLLSTDANKEFKDAAPWHYSASIEAKERFTSHFIPDDVAEKFIQGAPLSADAEFQNFLETRSQLILDKLETET